MKKNILIIAFIFLLLMTSCSGSKIKDWDLNYISIEKLWNYSKGNGQTIAFIDTGLSPAAVNLYKNYNGSIKLDNKVA